LLIYTKAKLKKSIFILSFIILSGTIFGQKAEFLHILYKQLNQSDGLANNSLLTITQDDKGYIWVVTQYDGIQRYDGVRFQRFGQQFVDTISHFSKVRNLNFEHGQLIAQVDDSYYRFNYADGKFYQITVGADKKYSFVNNEGTRYTLTPVYVKLEYIQTPERNAVLKLPSPNAGSRSYVAYDQYDGKYWVAYYGQLVSLDIKSGKAVLVSQDNYPELYELFDKMGRHGFSNIYCDSDRNLWLNNWVGVLARYNLNTRKYYIYSMETGRRTNMLRNYNAGVTAFFEDNHHQVWIGSLGAGLMKYDKEEDLFRFFASDGKATEDIFNSEIRAFYQDKHENIWLGTSNGIRIFNPYRAEITVLNVRIKDFEQAITRNNSIEYAVQLKNGDIWVATWGNGVIVYDAELRIKKHYLFDDETSNMVWTIIEDKDDMVWLGCQAGNIRRFNKKTQRFEAPTKILNNISTIHGTVMDEEGNIYFGMNNGSIAKWDRAHKKFSLKRNGEKNQGVSRMITSIKLDSNQKLWARTQRYLYCFDNKTLVCKYSIPLVPLHLTIYKVGIEQGMTQYNDSLFVLASYFGKFGIFNVKSKNFAPLTLKENLALARILEVRKDGIGNIWFTTSNALYRLNPQHQLNNFVADKGLITSSFSKSSSSVMSDGR